MAVLSETIDTVEAGDTGVVQDSDERPMASKTSTTSPAPTTMIDDESSKDSTRNMLRQRLRAAVDGQGS